MTGALAAAGMVSTGWLAAAVAAAAAAVAVIGVSLSAWHQRQARRESARMWATHAAELAALREMRVAVMGEVAAHADVFALQGEARPGTRALALVDARIQAAQASDEAAAALRAELATAQAARQGR